MISVSVIVPAYNEEESIVSAISRDLEVLDAFKCNYELLVVNDGSADGTLDLLNTHFSQQPSLKIISNAKNQGFGGAVRTGMQHVTRESIIVVPVDSPLEPKMFQAFIEHYNQ